MFSSTLAPRAKVQPKAAHSCLAISCARCSTGHQSVSPLAQRACDAKLGRLACAEHGRLSPGAALGTSAAQSRALCELAGRDPALKAIRSSACTRPNSRTTPMARAPGVAAARFCSFDSTRSTTCQPVLVEIAGGDRNMREQLTDMSVQHSDVFECLHFDAILSVEHVMHTTSIQ